MSILSNIKWFFKERYRVIQTSSYPYARSYTVQCKLSLSFVWNDESGTYPSLEDAIYQIESIRHCQRINVCFIEK